MTTRRQVHHSIIVRMEQGQEVVYRHGEPIDVSAEEATKWAKILKPLADEGEASPPPSAEPTGTASDSVFAEGEF